MSKPKITRGEFLRGGSCAAAGAILGNMVLSDAAPCQGPCGAAAPAKPGACPALGKITLRPYQLLCIYCAVGEKGSLPKEGPLAQAVKTIQANPDIPVTLCCNAGDVFVYQDPGTAEDPPEGSDYNRKRDMDVLQRLGLPPGVTLPARILLGSVLKKIPTVAGLCACEKPASAAWKGCPKAASGAYEKGRAKGVKAVIAPRSEQEMAKEKAASTKKLYQAKEVTVRPHILVCAVSQYGGGIRPPFKADNLPELLDVILHKNPDLVIRFARGADWMMCAPCSSRVPGLNACVCGPCGNGGLYNELKDLNVLERLGLTFASKMKARDLYRLLLEKIPSVAGVCALPNHDNPAESLWWDPCGSKSNPCPNYAKGREKLIKELQQI
jgi:hypothetical protein